MAGLKHQFASSSFWVIIGRGSANVASFVVFVLLARLLGPTDFGLVAFAALFIDLTRPLALAGFPQALVQRPTWEHDVSSNAFWGNIAFATCLSLILCLVFTPFMVSAYDPQLKWVMPALSSTLLIDALRAPHEALLQRQFSYKALAKRTIIATVAGGIIGVALAYTGFGIWALVVNRVATSVIQTIIIWVTVRWTPSFTFSREKLRPLLAYGLHLSGASLFGELNRRVPDLMIGALLGPAAVGLFRVGSRAVNMLNDAIIQPMSATALSTLSRVHERGSVATAYLRITKACGLLSFPLYFGAAVTANDFIATFFGAKWQGSGDVMAVLALLGGAGTLNYFSGPALSAAGKTQLLFWQTLISFLSTVAITAALLKFGVLWVAVGITVRAYLVVPVALLMLKRGLQLDPMAVVRGVLPPFVSAVGMGLILLALKIGLLQDMVPLLRLAIMVPCGALLYGAKLWIFGRSYSAEMHTELAPIVQRLAIWRRGDRTGARP
jgi:O-antigen/teichoic acid export membrane protein